MIGRLKSPDSSKSDMSWEEYGLTYDIQHTFTDMELNNRGEFLRAFDSLDAAKQYAMAIANIRSYANKENVISKDILKYEAYTNKSLERKYNAIIMLRKYVEKILKFICEYEYPSESQSGGELEVAAEKLGVDKELMKEMLQYVPMELLPRTQRKAEKILKDIRDEEKRKMR